jgi:hypothetical protein
MGYTHYWQRPTQFEANRFKRWVEDVRTILANLPKRTKSAGGYYANRVLRVEVEELSDELVNFNGAGGKGEKQKWVDAYGQQHEEMYWELSHETFYVQRTFSAHYSGQRPDERGLWFEFCKTARKPYDLAVTAALIRLAYHFPEGVEISSDGNEGEWEEGRALCERLFGVGVVPFRGEREEAA